MTERERIGKKVAELRKEKGLLQDELAELSGLRQQSISRIEQGMFNTTIDTLSKIAEALGKNIDFIDKNIN